MAEAEKTRTLTDAEKTVVAAQKANAKARLATAELEVEAAKADLASAAHPPVPLGAPTEDALGEPLDWSNPEEAKAQQRAAKAEQLKRAEIDVQRTIRGQEPLFATK